MKKEPQKRGIVILNSVAALAIFCLLISTISFIWTQSEVMAKLSISIFLILIFSMALYYFLYYEEEKED